MPLLFLKLGGSLITDKDQTSTPRAETIDRLAREIARGVNAQPDLRLILGHGSGSFGHVAARKHGTRQGVNTPEGWRGFVEVWQQARALNEMVLQSMLRDGAKDSRGCAMAFGPGLVAETMLFRSGR